MSCRWDFRQQCPECKRIESYTVMDGSYAWTTMCPRCGCEHTRIVKCRKVYLPGQWWNPFSWFDFTYEVSE